MNPGKKRFLKELKILIINLLNIMISFNSIKFIITGFLYNKEFLRIILLIPPLIRSIFQYYLIGIVGVVVGGK